MKHTVTMVHEVEADNWDLAVEEVIKAPIAHLVDCRVKSPGSRLVHVTVSVIKARLGLFRA